jgi:hypothetical protein
MYRAAANNDMSFEQYVNRQYPATKYGKTFDQLLASEGIFLRGDRDFGIRASSMDEILNGRSRMEAGVIVKDAVPQSRILAPAAILTAVEDKMVENLTMTPNAFSNMIAFDESIAHDRWERVVFNYSKPEEARSQAIAQLAMPASMLLVTAGQISRAIPSRSLGLEISDQAMRATSIDLLALSLARQRLVERNVWTNEFILSLLNGDADMNMSPLASIPNKVQQAKAFDPSITTQGTLTQLAWVMYLFNNSMRRMITHVITDIAGALAIENRTGRPNVMTDDNKSPRINTEMTVVNPLWPTQVKVFIMPPGSGWPANTIMGFDSFAAIHRVTSSTIAYEAVESFVLKRSTAMRFDSGEVVERLQDDAFDVLTLTV